jgi:hypothetical protein
LSGRSLLKSFLYLGLALLLTGCGQAVSPAPSPAQPDITTAQETLVAFFDLLAAGEYQQAASLHGGPEDFYQTLQDFNPDVPGDDLAALLQAGCERQFVCMPVEQVLRAEQVSENEFLFTVRFANPDGTTFVLGPCCGADETEMPPVSEFEYNVSYDPQSAQYLVLGGPVYVP